MASIQTETPRLAGVRALSAFDWIALALLIVGGINWGLVGLLNFDLVATLFGPMSWPSRLVYALVGAAALFAIYLATRLRVR
jgi:hypothetical protein